MTISLRLILAALALTALAACGGTGASSPKTFDTGNDEAASSTEQSTAVAPNVGDRALKLGKTRHGRDTDTTLIELKFPYPPGEYRQVDDPKNAWLGLMVKQCLHKDVKPVATDDDSLDTTYNGDWAAISSDDFDYATGGSSWSDWPAPKFPEGVGMVPGRCYKGWMAIEIPKDTKIKRIEWRPGGSSVAEWTP